MNILRLSQGELGVWLAGWLGENLAADGQRPAPRFHALPGQDPMAHTTPQAALSALYWAATPQQRLKLGRALRDLVAHPMRWLSEGALETLVRTAALTADRDALLPLIKTVGSRGPLGPQAMPIYSTLLSAARGFGPCEHAWDAARTLADLRWCPEKLVFDVFDLGVADQREPWWPWFKRLEEVMCRVCTIRRLWTVRVRLGHSAQHMADSLTVADIEVGLRELVGDVGLSRPKQEWAHAQVPRELLAAALIGGSTPPFAVRADGPWSRLERSPLPQEPSPDDIDACADSGHTDQQDADADAEPVLGMAAFDLLWPEDEDMDEALSDADSPLAASP